jgi:hypothetical protein
VKISIRRSGGFIPLPVTAELDTAQLSAADAEKANALVQTIDTGAPPGPNQPDSSVYHITAGDRELSSVEGTPAGAAAAQLFNLATQTGAQKR